VLPPSFDQLRTPVEVPSEPKPHAATAAWPVPKALLLLDPKSIRRYVGETFTLSGTGIT
jgi:hypothetical protein